MIGYLSQHSVVLLFDAYTELDSVLLFYFLPFCSFYFTFISYCVRNFEDFGGGVGLIDLIAIRQ